MKHNKIFANSTSAGRHADGNISYHAQEDIPERYIFCRFTDTPSHICPATNPNVKDNPPAIGIATDNVKAKSLVNLHVLNAGSGTYLVQADAPITQGQAITCSPNSKAVPLSSMEEGHTYYTYGIALQNANKGQLLEFAPTLNQTQTI